MKFQILVPEMLHGLPWLRLLFSAASDSCPSDLRSVGRFPTWTFGEGVEIVTTAEVLEQNKREKKKKKCDPLPLL